MSISPRAPRAGRTPRHTQTPAGPSATPFGQLSTHGNGMPCRGLWAPKGRDQKPLPHKQFHSSSRPGQGREGIGQRASQPRHFLQPGRPELCCCCCCWRRVRAAQAVPSLPWRQATHLLWVQDFDDLCEGPCVERRDAAAAGRQKLQLECLEEGEERVMLSAGFFWREAPALTRVCHHAN